MSLLHNMAGAQDTDLANHLEHNFSIKINFFFFFRDSPEVKKKKKHPP